ncbi:MAG TPA: phosphomannomutase/phosphoglucomutase [Candidatus Gallacutalibacter stercoravium]|nr:phosphomannomutase/phosphoglucomutase [Candidatus Gallacutalibacter stercoravium]
MLEQKWKILKSGTDIRGVASEGAPGQEINLTGEAVRAIAGAFALWLSQKTGKQPAQLKLAVGRDSRLSGPRIRDAVVSALSKAGIQVLDCGLASTPAMFMTTVDLECDGSIQITASHHPFYRNGLKFFTSGGGLEGTDIEQLLYMAQAGEQPPAAQGGCVIPTDYMQQYAAGLRRLIVQGVDGTDKPLQGFHIVVDAGNGAGGFYASQVLQPLGADISGSQFLQPDGRFPNHIPNPEDETAMASVCAATVKAKADLGVIFDTDVDRAGAVDDKGREINRNRLVAMASAIALEGHPGGTVVTDSITSDGLKQFIEKQLGGVHHRFKRGYKNVINEAIRLNQEGIDCPLAIETSGHAALRENYFLDDGAYLITKIIIKMACLRREGRTLEDLIATLAEPVEAKELRFAILEKDFAACGNRVLAQLEAYAAQQPGWKLADDSREGVRVSIPQAQGWFLLRLSVHDPIMPLNVESDIAGGVQEILSQLAGFFQQVEGLDTTVLFG